MAYHDFCRVGEKNTLIQQALVCSYGLCKWQLCDRALY